MESSVWNDDQKIWILPNFLNTLRLPPANLRSAFQKPAIKSIEDNNNVQYRKVTSTDSSDSDVILYIYKIDKKNLISYLNKFFNR